MAIRKAITNTTYETYSGSEPVMDPCHITLLPEYPGLDLDTITEPGLYLYFHGHSGAMFNQPYFLMVGTLFDNILQTRMGIGNTATVENRMKWSDRPTWEPWVKVAGEKEEPRKLLETPLQSHTTISTATTATLSDNYMNYDVIAYFVSQGVNSSEGNWNYIMPKITGANMRSNWSINMFQTNYYGVGSVTLKNNNQVELIVRVQAGWANNGIYLGQVVGIKF